MGEWVPAVTAKAAEDSFFKINDAATPLFTKGGAFSPWAFLAWAKIIDSLFARDRANDFSAAREPLEEFLLENKWAMTEIIHKNGSGHRSTPWLERYWRFVTEQFMAGMTVEQVTAGIPKEKGFDFLQTRTPVIRLPGENSGRNISASTRTAAIWDAALPGAPRCPYCCSRYHRNSIHGDHVLAKRDGGDGRPSNVAIAHPYCDSTYKDLRAAKAS